MSMKILVVGSLAYDRILNFDGVFAEHIVPDKIHELSLSFYTPTLRESFGGCSGNIAYSLALLGATPTILARGGNDFERYNEWLLSHGVDTSHIERDAERPTGHAIVITDAHNNQIAAFHPGSMGVPYSGAVPSGDFGIVSPTNPDDMRAAPGWFREAGIPYLFDPGQQIPTLSGDDLKSGITKSKGLISNDYELSLVLKKTGWREEDVLGHTEMIVTTLGEKGSRIRTRDTIIDIPPATPDNTSDPTGAGDAYRAGLIWGMVSGWPLETAGRLAGLVATYTVEQHGTQTHAFTTDELRERYRKNFTSELPH